MTVTLPVLVPACAGVKVTLMEQLAPEATELPQVLVSAKSPVATMLERVNIAEPKFPSVTSGAALVVWTGWLGKVKLLAERVT